MERKRTNTILLITAILLLIPLIAMQFTDEVNWDWMDFLVAGVLLTGTGFLIDLATRTIKNSNYRTAIIIVLLLGLVTIWAEMAVGIFGSPIAGN